MQAPCYSLPQLLRLRRVKEWTATLDANQRLQLLFFQPSQRGEPAISQGW